MIDTLFYINNVGVNPPSNWEDLLVELNYGKDQFPQANTVSITDFKWVRENFDWFMAYIAGGLTGDVGIMEAPPFRIDITDGVSVQTVFTGYIDLTNGLIIHDKKGSTLTPDGFIQAKAVSHASVDWLFDIASSFTPEYLASPDYKATGLPGFIDPSYYKFMPYTQSEVPNYAQAAMCTLMTFSLINSIDTVVVQISNITIDTSNPFTTANGILKAAVEVGYLIVLIATLIKTSEDLYKFLISPVKYHAGMYVRDIMERCASYLYMTFQSDIWGPGSPYENEYIIPEKLFNQPVNNSLIAGSGLLGFLTPDLNEQFGWPKKDFGWLLNAFKTKYNAKIIVTVPPGGATATNMGIITLIRRDKNAAPPVYQLKDYYQPEYTFNTDELQSNTEILFQNDSTDMNTLQNFQGSLYQVICQPNVVNYRPFVMFKNFDSVQIPFARASTKTSLTVPEIIFQDFINVISAAVDALIVVVNAFISGLNALISLVNKLIKAIKTIGIKINFTVPSIPKISNPTWPSFNNRIGMMLLSADHFQTAKILILKEGSQPLYNKIDPSNDGWDSAYKVQTLANAVQHAQAHWNKFYYVNSMVPASINPAYADRPYGAQYRIVNLNKIPFTWDDFLSVMSNNAIMDAAGKPGLLVTLKFNPRKQVADLQVRFSQIWTLNLNERYLNPSGA